MFGKAPVPHPCVFLAQFVLLVSMGISVQAQSPVGHWEFNDASGTTTADSSGNGHTAGLFNGLAWSGGKVAGGITANAALRQFVFVPAVDLSGTKAVTVALWSKRTYSQVGGHVLFEASGNYNNSTAGFVFLPDDETCQGIQIGIHGDVGYTASCYGQPTSRVWHHLAVVFDKSQTGGNAIAFYVDGSLQSPTRSLYASTNTNDFGNQPIYLFSRGGITQFDSGTVDDFKIYNKALSFSQLQLIYQSGLSQIGKDVTVSVDGAGTMTTPSFTTSSNAELLVAFVGYDGPSGSPQTTIVSGGGLVWKLVQRSNGQLGTAEVWAATAPNAPFTATVTSRPGSVSTWHGSMTVIGFTNASGTGIVGKAGATTGAPDVKLAGVSAGNWVFAVGNDWDNPVARSPASGQVLVHQRVDTQIGDTYWVQATAAPSTITGPVDIHDNAPTTDRWNYAAVEIVANQVGTYSISGTVSGAGGPGATVNMTGAATASTTADTGGNYTFSGLANGSYTVTPSKSGYVYTPASQAVSVSGANVGAVNFNSTTAPTYSISGTISGAGGPGATVNLTGAATASTTADTGGNYTFSGLANGSYTVTPSKSGYVYTPASQAVSVSGANVGAVNFNSTTAPTYSISGTISGAGGPGATVNLTGAATASTTADTGGNYTLSGLANGSYTVTPSKSGYVYTPASRTVTVGGANVAAVNFRSAASTYSISGTISGAGGPGATVNLTGAATASTTADTGGNYAFAGLANGSYTVTPSKTGYVYTPASKAVTVSGANVVAVNFSSAAPTYSISGAISGGGGPGATVNLTGAATASTTADTGGNYTFAGLANGSYTVTPSKSGYVYTPASRAVTVSGANVVAVNFSSAASTYSISGTISGAGGPGATINLTGAATASTTADTGGNYSFAGLANGNYTVTPSKSGYVYLPASRAVTVSGANVVAVNFSSAAPTYSISGIISGAGGPGATVNLTGAVTASTTADTGGNYSFTGLANGSYTVTPSKPGYVYTPASRAVTVSGANVAAIDFGSAVVSHWVDLSWTASLSQVVGYNVYRATTSQGPYTKSNGALLTSTTYGDQAVLSGSTYYYVTTAVDSQGRESAYSNEAVAPVP